jgi:hypothetical protein
MSDFMMNICGCQLLLKVLENHCIALGSVHILGKTVCKGHVVKNRSSI